MLDRSSDLAYNAQMIGGPRECVDQWMEIYSQTWPNDFGKDSCRSGDCNVNIDNENFIKFNDLEGRDSYHFQIVWNEKLVNQDGDVVTGDTEFEWEQDVFPLAGDKGVEVLQNARFNPSDDLVNDFKGLRLSASPDCVLTGVQPGSDLSSPIYCIGLINSKHNGHPAYEKNGSQLFSKKTQLFIRL